MVAVADFEENLAEFIFHKTIFFRATCKAHIPLFQNTLLNITLPLFAPYGKTCSLQTSVYVYYVGEQLVHVKSSYICTYMPGIDSITNLIVG